MLHIEFVVNSVSLIVAEIQTLAGNVRIHFEDYAPPTEADNPRMSYVIDGDTIHCGYTRVRLAGIDAPEMPGHCQPGRACT